MDYLQTLMRYKAWANELVFDAAAKLPQAELTAPRKIVFGSMLRTLNHVYAMDEVWRAHSKAGRTAIPPAIPKPVRRSRSCATHRKRWMGVRAICRFPGREDETVEFRFIGGGPER